MINSSQPQQISTQNPINGVIWIVKQGFYLYLQDRTDIISYSFLPDSIRFYDVIRKDLFQKEIIQFIETNKLPPLNLFVILGPDTLIEKKIVKPQLNIDQIKNEFIDLIPYEHVFSKIWDSEKEIILAATNAEVIIILKSVIETQKGKINSLVPYFKTNQSKPTIEFLKDYLKIHDLYKSDTMFNSQIIKEESATFQNSVAPPENTQKSELPLLLGVFGILGIILIIMIFFQFQQPTPKPIRPKKIIPKVQPTITPILNQSNEQIILPSSSSATNL